MTVRQLKLLAFVQNMMLCESCAGVTLKALRARPSYPHSTSFNALEASSKTCQLCAVLWDAASNYGLFERRSAVANSEDTVYLQVEEAGDDDGLLRRIRIVTYPEVLDEFPDFNPNGFEEQLAIIALYSEPGSPAANIVNTQRVALRADSDAAFNTVHHWLWECSKNHPSCPILPAEHLKYMSSTEHLPKVRPLFKYALKQSKEIERPSILPSRVLDVGPPDGSQEPSLYVCEKPTYGFWIALSHCWGTVPLLRTTTRTIGEHIKGIPTTCLPPSFRDAVTITRRLGIRYLWIDSLCIIQDNLEDWRVESSQMSRTYGMSFLTIIAAGASNSHGGCFIPRSVRFPPACLHPHDSSGPFYATEYIADSGANLPRSFDDREPTDRRGWCFQEALLPKRTLYYGTKMMTWRCKSGCFPEQGSSYGYNSEPLTLYHELDRHLYGYSRWEYIVQEYTQRLLTQQEDKLIALAGIAEELSRIWKDAYLAGLWKGDIVRQLLWEADWRKDRTFTRTGDFLAPSWSWAAINGPIRFRAHWLKEYEELTSVVEAEVIPLSNIPFGGISSGTMKLKGPIERVRGTWEFIQGHLATVTSGLGSECEATCFLDVWEERDWPSTELWCLRMVSKLCQSDYELDHENPQLLVLRVYALLLVPTDGADGEFIRVGVARLNYDTLQTGRVATITIV